MGWYYGHGEQRVGPLDDAAIETLVRSRVIGLDTLIWRQGMQEWIPLRKTDLAKLFSADVPPPLPATPHLSTTAEVRSNPSRTTESFEDKARISMIVSLAGILLFGLVTGIIGIVFASQALAGMSRTGNDKGKGMAVTGLVVGILDVLGWLIFFSSLG